MSICRIWGRKNYAELSRWAQDELTREGQTNARYWRHCPYCRAMTWHTIIDGQFICTRKGHLDAVRLAVFPNGEALREARGVKHGDPDAS